MSRGFVKTPIPWYVSVSKQKLRNVQCRSPSRNMELVLRIFMFLTFTNTIYCYTMAYHELEVIMGVQLIYGVCAIILTQLRRPFLYVLFISFSSFFTFYLIYHFALIITGLEAKIEIAKDGAVISMSEIRNIFEMGRFTQNIYIYMIIVLAIKTVSCEIPVLLLCSAAHVRLCPFVDEFGGHTFSHFYSVFSMNSVPLIPDSIPQAPKCCGVPIRGFLIAIVCVIACICFLAVVFTPDNHARIIYIIIILSQFLIVAIIATNNSLGLKIMIYIIIVAIVCDAVMFIIAPVAVASQFASLSSFNSSYMTGFEDRIRETEWTPEEKFKLGIISGYGIQIALIFAIIVDVFKLVLIRRLYDYSIHIAELKRNVSNSVEPASSVNKA